MFYVQVHLLVCFSIFVTNFECSRLFSENKIASSLGPCAHFTLLTIGLVATFIFHMRSCRHTYMAVPLKMYLAHSQ